MGSINVPLTSLFDLFGLACFANKNKKNVSYHTADSKPVKWEVNCTVIHPPLVFPNLIIAIARKDSRSTPDLTPSQALTSRVGSLPY